MLVYNKCCFDQKWGDFPVLPCSDAVRDEVSLGQSTCAAQAQRGYPCACINDVNLYSEMQDMVTLNECRALSQVVLSYNKQLISNPNVTAGK